MISKWRWLLEQFTARLWVRATLFAAVGVATALLGVLAETFTPWEVGDVIGADSVGTVLNVLASSMLAVTTFSLGVMISAYSAASSNVTPRATRLLRRDSTSQNVLSTFIGSFLFSLVGIVTLSIEGYGQTGRIVLFVVTLGVIVVIVATLLRWIEHVNGLGRVGETTSLVERAALKAIDARLMTPCLGGHPLVDAKLQVPQSAMGIEATSVGYVQHIDAGALQSWCNRNKARVYLAVLPGTFAHPGRKIGWIDGADECEMEDRQEALRSAVTIAKERTYDQDPRFGLIVLSEIASRALSPGINDSGTAIDVIGRQLRLMLEWAKPPTEESRELKCPLIFVPPIRDDDLFDDAFSMIARDGADKVEVQIRLQKALRILASVGNEPFRLSARHMSRVALERAEAALPLESDKERVRDLARLAQA